MSKDNPTMAILQTLQEARALAERSNKLVAEAEKIAGRLTVQSVVTCAQAAILLGCTTRTLHNMASRNQIVPRNADGTPKTTTKNTKTFYSLAEIWKLLNP